PAHAHHRDAAPVPGQLRLRVAAAHARRAEGDPGDPARDRRRRGARSSGRARLRRSGGESCAAMEMSAIEPGRVDALSARVRRITAPNPGVMTGPGTNAYVIGAEALALIDPGPPIDAHIEALRRLVGTRLRWILCTHTHLDHSPAAAALRAATGAQVIGRPPPDDGRHDTTFVPDRIMADGEVLETPEFRLRAVHTPGHSSEHLCYLLEEERLLFTGDHVM